MMSTLTVFSAPKPFSDPHINIIQRNAVRSWKALGPRAEVLLIGDEQGIKEAAEESGVRHIPQVERNDQGTPLVSSIFNLAREYSSHGILVYLNADIILLPECLAVIDAVLARRKDFLLVGQRWDLDITRELKFTGDWSAALEDRLEREGRLHNYTAMDYFIFPRHLLRDIPPFAVGRAGWDNWMIYNAVNQPWPVIDLTPSHRVIHQNHDYRHLPGGAAHYNLEESHHNVALAGGMRTSFDLLDVPLVFQDGEIRKKGFSLRRTLRKLERIIMPAEQQGWRWQLTRILRKLGREVERRGLS